jgi:hypothetical protein
VIKGWSGRARLLAVAAVLAGLAGAGAAGAPPSPHPAVISAERAVAGAAHYWTRARMAAARAVTPVGQGALQAAEPGPAAGSRSGAQTLRAPWVTSGPWPGGGAVARTTGKVFFTLDGTDYVCSGSTVASANSDVVRSITGPRTPDPVF